MIIGGKFVRYIIKIIENKFNENHRKTISKTASGFAGHSS